ncbi:MAG: hypothetical protein EOO75_10750 [Myxococcales bacterium]|nr:MAG: hypothetical protein EOO75_10750 [Myxococcales bacterium]
MRELILTRARVVVVKGVARVLAQIESDPGGPESHAYMLLGALKKDSRSIVYAAVAGSAGDGSDAVQVLDSGAIVQFGRHVPSDVDSSYMGGHRAWREVIPGKPGAEPPGWETEGESEIVEVPGDQVLVMRPSRTGDGGPRPLSAVWLRSGTSIVLDGTETKRPADFVRLRGGLMGLPPTPGQAFAIAAPAQAPRQCVDELVVGPRTSLWLCYRPTGASGWSHTAGVQVRRF